MLKRSTALSRGAGHLAVEVLDAHPELGPQVRGHPAEEGGVLAEHHHRLALFDDLLGQLDEPVELAGATGERGLGVFVRDGGGVVADLLELGDPGEHPAASRHAGDVGDLARHVLHHRLVERGLLTGQRAVVPHDDALGQLVGDARVGLVPTQDKRGDALAAARRVHRAGRGARRSRRSGP